MLSVREEQFDVAIAGAGPAGSSAAIRLAQAGFSVLLVEQKQFPREKLCGEFISPECLTHFDELGVLPSISAGGGAELTETVFYSRNGKHFSIDNKWFGMSARPALGLSRAEMDLCLLRRARDVGVTVLENTSSTGPIFDEERVIGLTMRSKNGREEKVLARMSIDATGRARALARCGETRSKVPLRADLVAFKAHIQGARTGSGTCEIYSYRGGYGGCNQIENGLHNLCFIASASDVKRFGSEPERVMRKVLFTNRRAAEALKETGVAAPWLAVPITHFGRGKLVPAAGLITMGDAAAFMDPFTGSGILLALESAKIASDAVANHLNSDLSAKQFESEYEVAYSAAIDSRLRFSSVMRAFAFTPFVAETLVAALSMSSTVRRRIARATRS